MPRILKKDLELKGISLEREIAHRDGVIDALDAKIEDKEKSIKVLKSMNFAVRQTNQYLRGKLERVSDVEEREDAGKYPERRTHGFERRNRFMQNPSRAMDVMMEEDLSAKHSTETREADWLNL